MPEGSIRIQEKIRIGCPKGSDRVQHGLCEDTIAHPQCQRRTNSKNSTLVSLSNKTSNDVHRISERPAMNIDSLREEFRNGRKYQRKKEKRALKEKLTVLR